MSGVLTGTTALRWVCRLLNYSLSYLYFGAPLCAVASHVGFDWSPVKPRYVKKSSNGLKTINCEHSGPNNGYVPSGPIVVTTNACASCPSIAKSKKFVTFRLNETDNSLLEKGVAMSEARKAEIQELRENVRNLSDCLRTVVDRLEKLEHQDSVEGGGNRKVIVVDSLSAAGSNASSPRSPLTEAINMAMDTSESPIKLETHTEVKDIPGGKITTTVTSSSQRVVKSTSYQKALVSAYDSVARREYEPSSELLRGLSYFEENPAHAHRVVGIRKPKGQDTDSLGLTVRQDNGQLVVARVLDDSPIAKQGLVHVGDTILEVNGKPVKTPEQLKQEITAAHEGVIVKLIPAPIDLPPATQAYVKAFFDYDPLSDALIPCKEIGLSFKSGDILQVISKDDGKWWQARKVYDSSRIGLIPSQALEESRRSNCPDHTKKQTLGGLVTIKKKRKVMYNSRRTSDFDKHELNIYEEVGKMSPYGRKVLVLVGAPGVGRRTLKSRLLRYDPLHFATIVPFTSRSKRQGESEGREYHFIKKDVIQKNVEAGDYLEWGEFNGNIYGTRFDSVRDIITSGKMCVLDCSPQAIKQLYNWEYMPYIVFVSPPPLEELKQLYATAHVNALKPKTEGDLARTCEESAKLEASFKHYFDLTLTNRNAEVTFRRLLDALETLKTQPQWVPVTWLYG